jgi:hypothetical protein
MKQAIAHKPDSLNGVAAKVLGVMPFGAPVSVSTICSELYRRGSRVDFNIVHGCLRALVSSGHAKESPPGEFARTTVAAGDEPEQKSPLRVVHPQPEKTMTLPAHVAKGITETHTPQQVTEREPLQDIGVLAARLRESGRALLMWAEDLERLGLEFEQRVDAAGQDGKQLAQLRSILKNLGV